MGPRYLTATTVALIALSSTALGQTNFTTNWNPMGEGCVDTTGFLSCYSDQSTKAASCTSACDQSSTKGSSSYNTCVDACNELWLADNIGCWLQSCWNQVYSCAYQLTALSYFDGSGLAQNGDVPFYPPPDDASVGACSCNLGYVYGNLSAISTSTQGSACEVVAGGDNATLYACECCELSWPISNILNACPKSDLSGINFENGVSFPTYIKRIVTTLTPSPNKCAILDNSTETCINDYNFPFAGNTSYNPLALPAGEPGTEPLSNAAGNAFSVFPSASINLTLTLAPSYTSTITPASFVAASASADPQSIAGTSILGGTTTSISSTTTRVTSTSSSASASATTTKKSAGVKMGGDFVLLSIGVLSVIIGML